MAHCVCCGPAAVERLRFDKFVSKNNQINSLLESQSIHIICVNPECGHKQSFQCAMLFCDRVYTKVPKKAWKKDNLQWKKGMPPPLSPILLQNCIACSLRASIPDESLFLSLFL